MRADLPSDHVTKKSVVLGIPGMEAALVRRDVPYRTDAEGTRTLDLYRPATAPPERPLPVVVLVNGFPEPGFERVLGCKHKEMAASISWAQLLAASGLAAIAYTNQEPVADLAALLRALRSDAATLAIDPERVALWACSGNAPLALSVLLDRVPGIVCAAILYGYTMDLDGGSEVADMARKVGFTNPAASRSLAELSPDLPLFLARAGRDAFPGLNVALDRFVAHALRRDQPLSLVNHATAPHAFDLYDDGAVSRDIVRQVLAFLQLHLRAAAPAESSAQSR